MAKQNRNTLKGYFETGDIPTGGNYVDLIDSPLILDSENTGSLDILGTITASGDISASGNLMGNTIISNNTSIVTFEDNKYDFGNNPTFFRGNITASGNISASGIISAFGSSSLVGLPTTEPLVSGGLWLSGSGGGSASGSKYLMVFTG